MARSLAAVVDAALEVEAAIWQRERSQAEGDGDARTFAAEALMAAGLEAALVDDAMVAAYMCATPNATFRSRDTTHWDARARKLRWLNTGQLAFCALVIASAFAGLPLNAHVLRAVVVLSTLAEMAQWLGHMWLWRPGRTLPLWCVSDAVGLFVERHPLVNALCTALALVLLMASLVAPQLLFVAAAVLTLVSFVDLWRALYMHYWLVALFALHFPNTPLSMCLILGNLYLFSGVAKFVSPAFHEQTAPWVFEPVYRALRVKGPRWRYWLSRMGVAGEAVIGACVLLAFALPASIHTALALAIVALHAYIIVGIGVRTGIRTFVSWNAFCACASVCVLQQGVSLWPVHPFHALVALVMVVPPLWPRVAAQYPTLAHAYFVPTVETTCLLVPAELAHRVPLCENGRPIRVWGPGSAIHGRACRGDPSMVVLCAASGWVDWAFSYGDAFDDCNECFATPEWFWRVVARRISPSCKVVRVDE